jgi:hypothetical protein
LPNTGVTTIEFPVPILLLPLYQTQLALLPRLPPFTVSVTVLVPQVESAVVEILVAAVLKVFTLIDLFEQAVLLQVPSARTKYAVVAEGLTVMELPEPTELPPQVPVYHLHDALLPRLPPTTSRVTLVPKQIESFRELMLNGAVEKELTLMVFATQTVVLHEPSART